MEFNEEKYDSGKLYYALVKDKDGNEYVCPIHALKSVDEATYEGKKQLRRGRQLGSEKRLRSHENPEDLSCTQVPGVTGCGTPETG